jgi:hypothetical protein
VCVLHVVRGGECPSILVPCLRPICLCWIVHVWQNASTNTSQEYEHRGKKTRKVNVREMQRKAAVGVELLGKLPPLRIYRCPLFFTRLFRFLLVPRRIPSPKSDGQASKPRARKSICEKLFYKGGMAASQIRMRMRIVKSMMDILNIFGI